MEKEKRTYYDLLYLHGFQYGWMSYTNRRSAAVNGIYARRSFLLELHLFPVLIFNMVILLFVFYQIDKRSYRKDIANGRKPDIRKPGTQFRLDGLHNIIFLVMIVGAVILSGVLPGMSAFQDAAGNVRGIHLFGEVTLTFPALIEIVIILLAAFLSFKTTDKQIRIRNHFTWGAIQEVAVLFIGIFITMQLH